MGRRIRELEFKEIVAEGVNVDEDDAVVAAYLRGASPATAGQFHALQHGRVYYLYEGCHAHKGALTTVLVHGFVGSHIYFAPLRRILATSSRLLLLDLYGRGFSDLPPPNVMMTTDLFVQQLLELLDVLGETRVNLVGYSMGGGVAMSFAGKYADRVEKLCLIAPAGFPSMRKSLPWVARAAWNNPLAGWLTTNMGGWLIVRGLKSRNRFSKEWVTDEQEESSSLDELHAAELGRFPREQSSLPLAAASSLRCFSWGELGDGRTDYKGPVLILWGEHDRTVPLAKEEALACLPQAQVTVVPRHGHMLPLQRPDLVASAYQDFIGITRSKM